MRLNREKVTIPNVLTILRALVIPWLFALISADPGKNWWKAGVFAITDNLDGMLARLGDKHTRLRSMGFRRSEAGRKWDPIVDKIFVTSMVVAGVIGGAIPLWLAIASLSQKAITSLITLIATIRKKQLGVTMSGKYGEFITNWGFGFLLAVSAIRNPGWHESGVLVSTIIVVTGILVASRASFDYARVAGLAK